MKTTKKQKILISGYYGFDNFGDEAILEVLTSYLKQNCDNIEIVVLSKSPDKTAAELGVKSIDRMNVFLIIKEMLSSQVIISGGGSLLQDVTSKATIYYYLLIILLGYLLGLKVIVYAQGIGPIKSKFNQLCTKFVLSLAKYISVRDSKSLNFLEHLKIRAELTTDPVWTKLNAKIADNEIVDKSSQKQIIGINIREWQGITDIELENLASVISELFDSVNNEILILPLHAKYDLLVSEKLADMLIKNSKKLKVNLINKPYTPLAWQKLIQSCDKIIAMRYHALLIALTNSIDVFGISYDPKVSSLLDSVDASYLGVNDLSSSLLREKMHFWFNRSKLKLTYDKSNFINYNFQAGQSLQNVVKIINEKNC